MKVEKQNPAYKKLIKRRNMKEKEKFPNDELRSRSYEDQFDGKKLMHFLHCQKCGNIFVGYKDKLICKMCKNEILKQDKK